MVKLLGSATVLEYPSGHFIRVCEVVPEVSINASLIDAFVIPAFINNLFLQEIADTLITIMHKSFIFM